MASLIAVMCTACGSSSKTSSPTTVGGSSATTSGGSNGTTGAPTGTPFGIFSNNNNTGPGNLAPLTDGLSAFVDYANSASGFGGRPGKLTICDNADDPQKAATCSRQALSDSSVLVAAASEGRQSNITVQTLAAGSDPVPDVCAGLNNAAEGTATNDFCLSAGTEFSDYATVTYLKQQFPNASKGYCTTVASTPGETTCNTVTAVAKANGESVTTNFFPASTSDFLPIAQAALSSGADWIYIGAGVPQELALIQAFMTLGSTKPLATVGELLPASTISKIGAAKFEIVADAQFPNPETSTDPEMVLYREWMTKEGHAGEIGQLSLSGWVSGEVIQNIAQNVQSPTRASILNYLRTQTLSGIPLEPSLSLQNAPKPAEGFSGLTSIANPTEYVEVVKNGTLTVTSQTETIP